MRKTIENGPASAPEEPLGLVASVVERTPFDTEYLEQPAVPSDSRSPAIFEQSRTV